MLLARVVRARLLDRRQVSFLVHEVGHGAEDGTRAVASSQFACGICAGVPDWGGSSQQEHLHPPQTGLDCVVWILFFFFLLAFSLFQFWLDKFGLRCFICWLLVYDVTNGRLTIYDFTISRHYNFTTLRLYDLTTLRLYDLTTLRLYDSTTLAFLAAAILHGCFLYNYDR